MSHDLDHITNGPGDTASTFDGTGAGVAVGDLDADGDLDLVLPNLSGATTILENLSADDLGSWERHDLQVGRFRGAAVVDIDADGDRDIVLTTGIGPPVLFEQSDPEVATFADRFTRRQIDGVRAAAYSMAWGDLGGDGDLDLVTGSYNAELTILRNSPVLGSDTGVILHEGIGTADSVVTRLSPDAQALATLIADLDGDGSGEILVGNDLATPDAVWIDNDGGWLRELPFPLTSYSTMSYDVADLDNDGRAEVFSTDMARMPDSPPENWVEVDRDMAAAPRVDDIQTPENMLNQFGDDGWENRGDDLGIRATGWSWSGLLGDLDNDGLQDVYVVNGMRSDLLFDFLPGARLVESNQAFRNNNGATMTPAPEWDLADTAGGRGAVMADLDRDGDLDIVVNNLDEPARVFENQICTGSAITVELAWEGTGNLDALGSTVRVRAGDVTHTRQVLSSRGYLSAAPSQVHVGLDGNDPAPVTVVVHWPDGEISETADVPAGTHLLVTRPAGS